MITIQIITAIMMIMIMIIIIKIITLVAVTVLVIIVIASYRQLNRSRVGLNLVQITLRVVMSEEISGTISR